jgi:hypothetical protein
VEFVGVAPALLFLVGAYVWLRLSAPEPELDD